ncbi:uncharacterized protein [Penaeus vannamei]|uniref:uncharacterized protein n=1 Tax=Penaeus vannamei TaxID=6689 RepID=UPI00387FA8B3
MRRPLEGRKKRLGEDRLVSGKPLNWRGALRPLDRQPLCSRRQQTEEAKAMGKWVAFVLLAVALAGPGQCITCYVCLPPVRGWMDSRKEAVVWRTKIARKWPGLEEGDFGECPDLSNADRFQRSCASESVRPACINASNEFWTARTCGILPANASYGCSKRNGLTLCYTVLDLGNSPGHRVSASAFLTVGLILAIAMWNA